jgi:hypothetical protein
MKQFIKQTLEIIKINFLLLLGSGLFTFGLFSFSSGSYLGKSGLGLPELGNNPYPISTYYYYNNISLFLLTIGIIFIVIGLLKYKK